MRGLNKVNKSFVDFDRVNTRYQVFVSLPELFSTGLFSVADANTINDTENLLQVWPDVRGGSELRTASVSENRKATPISQASPSSRLFPLSSKHGSVSTATKIVCDAISLVHCRLASWLRHNLFQLGERTDTEYS